MNAVAWANVTIAKKKPASLVLSAVTFLCGYVFLSSLIDDALLFYLSVPATVLICESMKALTLDPFGESLEMLYSAPKSIDIHYKFKIARALLCSAIYGIAPLISRMFRKNLLLVEDSATGLSLAIFTIFVAVLSLVSIKKASGLRRGSVLALFALQSMVAAFVGYIGFYAFRRYSLVIVLVALLFSVTLFWFVMRRGCSVEKAIVRSVLS